MGKYLFMTASITWCWPKGGDALRLGS